MRYQLINHGFPIGDKLIPVGTVISSDADDEWSMLAKGRVPPPNAVCLDQECWDLMQSVYDKSQILTAPNVRRR